MAHNAHLPSLPEIRKLLNTVFDDVELETFCLDYFSYIYDKFSRGMRKDEKLTLLLDYCREPERLDSLLRAMHECDQAKFHAFFEVKGILVPKLQGQNEPWTPQLYEVPPAYHFDLDEQLKSCLNALWGKEGLIGFVVSCRSPVFLENLGKRVEYELGRDRVRLMPPSVITSIRSDIEYTIRTMRRRYKVRPKEYNVLFTVQVPEEKIAHRFWQSLRDAAMRDELINRLIVIVGISPHCTLPKELIPLKAPHFGAADVTRWVRRVVNQLRWSEDVFDDWTKLMMAECSHENELQVEWVYDHLEAMLNLLKQNPTIEDFQEKLEKRRQLYVQTSP